MAALQALTAVFCLCSVLICTAEGNGSCYQFTGNGRVIFSGKSNIGESAHFKLKFKTSSSAGILYYAEGLYHPERVYDYEGLFLKDGYLYYFLFNPAPYSIGSSFGFRGKSNITLNDGNWHEVEFYRNLGVRSGSRGKMKYQTGLKVDGILEAGDHRKRTGVDIRPPFILGEDPHFADRANSLLGGFRGKIQDFQEIISNSRFTAAESDFRGDVTHCITGPDPV